MRGDDIAGRIKEHLPSAKVTCHDLTGGGDHWRVSIEAEEFRGLSLIEQHQLIYKVLGDWMKAEIHALSLDTSTPR